MSVSRIRTKLLPLFVLTVLVMGAIPGVSGASGTSISERTPLQPAPTQYWASERTPVVAVPFGDLDPAIRNALLRRQAAASLQRQQSYWTSEHTPVVAVPFGDLDPAIRNALIRRQAAASLPRQDPVMRAVIRRHQAAALLPAQQPYRQSTYTGGVRRSGTAVIAAGSSTDGGFAWGDAAIGGATVGGLLLLALVSFQFVERGLHKPRSL